MMQGTVYVPCNYGDCVINRETQRCSITDNVRYNPRSKRSKSPYSAQERLQMLNTNRRRYQLPEYTSYPPTPRTRSSSPRPKKTRRNSYSNSNRKSQRAFLKRNSNRSRSKSPSRSKRRNSTSRASSPKPFPLPPPQLTAVESQLARIQSLN